MEQVYDAKSIQALSDREHVRLRPSMYIASTNVEGVNQLLYEIVDNSIDEFLAGYGNNINVFIYKDGSVKVQDFGRGVPCDITKDADGNEINSLTLAFSYLMAGGKYNNDNYKFSSGQFGVGSSATNFLSEYFIVTVKRDGNIYQQKFKQGIAITGVEIIGKSHETGTEIYYLPDKEIFKQTIYPSEAIKNRLQELAALNSGLTINYINEITNSNESFFYEYGIINYLQQLTHNYKLLFDDPIYIHEDNIEIAFLINKELDTNSFIKSFCNNINNYEGGTHTNSTLKSLVENFNNIGIKNKLFKINLEQKYYLDNIFLIINVKMLNPSFEGQTKIKLNSIEIEPIIIKVINNYFKKNAKNDEIKQKILSIINYAIQLKIADDAAKKTRIEKRLSQINKKQIIKCEGLADCINAGTSKYSELFIVEGM